MNDGDATDNPPLGPRPQTLGPADASPLGPRPQALGPADASSLGPRPQALGPSSVTFHNLIARNKRNSALLVILMGLLTLGMAAAIGAAVMAYGTGVITMRGIVLSLLAGGVFVIMGSLWSYYAGSSALLAIAGARELRKVNDPELYNVVEELSIAGGIPMPRVYMMNTLALNAFATGRDPKHAAVAITAGLRQRLTRDELAGVMAHELAHVRHYDIRLNMLLATMVGMIVLASDVMWNSLRFSGGGTRRRSGSGKGGNPAALVMVIVALVLAIVAPMLARLLQLAVSRQREYLADAGAVELTRYPQGLADALKKLAADHTPLPTANRATAHMYIVNPILAARDRGDWNSVFSTHPPIHERIARLEALMR